MGQETQGASTTPLESDFGPDPDQIILSVDEPSIVPHVLAKFRLVSEQRSACISVHSLGSCFLSITFYSVYFSIRLHGKRDNLQLRLSAELRYQLKRFLTILDVEARVNGKGIVRAYRVVDDVVSIFHHVKGAIQGLAPVEKVEFFHAGPPVRNAVGADLPAEDFSIKGRGPFDVYDWDGEPAQLAVAFLL